MTKPTLLIVEDVKRLREELCNLLQDEFNVVAEASDGQQAVELYRKHEPQAVVMDIVMPRLSGIEATTQIVAEYSNAKIVVLSGLRDENTVLASLHAGAIDYLFKPVEMDKLKALLKEILKVESQNKAQAP